MGDVTRGAAARHRPVRLAIAGLGAMGRVHLRQALELAGAELTAIASHRADVARAVAADLDHEVSVRSFEELFASDDVDAVVIASRSIDHCKDVLAALEGGKHVLVEKPGATSLADHRRLAEAAQAKPHLCVRVAYNRRYDDAYAGARRLVESGQIGRPLTVFLTSRDMEWPVGENPRHTGGFLLDMAAHDYDFACSVIGDDPTEVYAARQGLVYPELMRAGDLDSALVTVRFRNGALAGIHVCRICRFAHDTRGEILAEEGSVLLGNAASAPGVTVLGREDATRFPLDFAERFEASYRAELAAFAAACRGDDAGPASLDEDRKAVAIGIAARASALQQRPLEVGIDWPWDGGFPDEPNAGSDVG